LIGPCCVRVFLSEEDVTISQRVVKLQKVFEASFQFI
jgi:hypothetical protein